MAKFYIGKVIEALPDYTIKFDIPGYAELASEGVASPAVKLTRFPQPNDEILLIQPNDNVEIFVYYDMNQDVEGISLQYGVGYLKISPEGIVNINGHLEVAIPS